MNGESPPPTSGNELVIQATLHHESWVLHEMGGVRVDLPGNPGALKIRNQGLGTSSLFPGNEPNALLMKTSTYHRKWLMAKLGFGDLLFEAAEGTVARLEDPVKPEPVLEFGGRRCPVQVIGRKRRDSQVMVPDLGWTFRYEGSTATVSGAADDTALFVALLLANYFWIAAVDA